MSHINVSVEGEPGHENWEVWFDTEEGDYHDGTIIGSGATFEEARDDALATLRQHVTELELKPHPDIEEPVNEEEEEDTDAEDS